MHRLFVAIDLPEQAKNALSQIRSDLPGARWVPVEQLHLTLRFIGDADDLTLQAIKAALQKVTTTTFDLRLSGIGHFPPGKHPHVLWTGMTVSQTLLSLQQQVEQAVTAAAMPPEERRFSPHITIARLKDAPARLVLDLEKKEGAFASPPFTVTDFHLYASKLTGSGAIHTKVATYRLQP